MIVIAIIGSIFSLTYQLTKSFIQSEVGAISSMEISTLASHSREKAMSQGETLTLELNLDKRTMGLRKYDPMLETTGEKPIWKTDDKNRDEEEEQAWIFEDIDFPADLTGFYSVSGLELEGPYIYFHFYPNGTSDSIIFYYEGREQPYYYISRYNTPGIYLDNVQWQYLDYKGIH